MQNIKKTPIEALCKYLLYGIVMIVLWLHFSCKQQQTSPAPIENISDDAYCATKVDSLIQSPEDHTVLDFENLSRQCQMKFLKQGQDSLSVMDSTSQHFLALSQLVYEAGYYLLEKEYEAIWFEAHKGKSVLYDNTIPAQNVVAGFDVKVKISVLIQYYTNSGFGDNGGILCEPVLGPILPDGTRALAIMIATANSVNGSGSGSLTISQYCVLNNPGPYSNISDLHLLTPPSPPLPASPFNTTIGSPIISSHDPRTYRFYSWDMIYNHYIKDNHLDPQSPFASDGRPNNPNGYIGFELGYIDGDMQTQIWDPLPPNDGSGAILSVAPYNYNKDDVSGITTLLPLYDDKGHLVFNPAVMLPKDAGGKGEGYIMEIGKPCPPYCGSSGTL
ncbi:MAG TPA: hypothetical protein VE978_25780 [Chitinophagales bacterium]|nr:hypothetical protein [Chitinophagales bacterium]